jgi:hypothetical protein
MNSASNGNAKMEHCADMKACEGKCDKTACPYEASAKPEACCKEGNTADAGCCKDAKGCEGMTKEECIKMTGKDCSAEGAKKECCAKDKAAVK